MKFTKKQLKEIEINYSLGKIIKLSGFERGAVNFNTIIETDQGKYIIRVVGRKVDSALRKRMRIEFKVLKYLNESDFPYDVPYPILKSNGKILSKINGRPMWIYKMLKGTDVDPVKGVTPNQNYEIGKALATYHKYINKIVTSGQKKEIDRLIGVASNYREKMKIKARNELDKLMLDNIKMFNDILKKIRKMKFRDNMLYNHSDMHAANILFENGKARGIIDFENIGYAPRIRDLSLSIKSGCNTETKEKRFLEGYESVIKLSKIEKKMIPFITLRDNCFFFDIFYGGKGNAKDEKERIKKNILGLNWIIGSTKKMVKRTGILD